ncbi:hypothetical protein [Streptomyces spinosirectus]
MRIRIDVVDLPGRNCASGDGISPYADIRVAVRRRDRPAELRELPVGRPGPTDGRGHPVRAGVAPSRADRNTLPADRS